MFDIKSRHDRTNIGILIILLVFVLAFSGTIKSGATTVKLNYVALGDSLAAGYAVQPEQILSPLKRPLLLIHRDISLIHTIFTQIKRDTA